MRVIGIRRLRKGYVIYDNVVGLCENDMYIGLAPLTKMLRAQTTAALRSIHSEDQITTEEAEVVEAS